MQLYEICTDYLIKHEGIRYKPYTDTVGKLTIGIGRNLTDKGLSKEEVMLLFKNDLDLVISQLSNYEWFKKLDDIRKYVLIDMGFNMGINKLLGFSKMIKYLENGLYIKAAQEMLESKWADQVKARAIDLSKMMETGQLC